MNNKDAKLIFWVIALPFKLVFWLFKQSSQQQPHKNGDDSQRQLNDLYSQSSSGGFVYVLSNPSMPGLVKIGMTTRQDIELRIYELNRSTGVPFPFKLEYAHPCNNPAQLERAIHRKFAMQRANQKREFFKASVEDVKRVLLSS